MLNRVSGDSDVTLKSSRKIAALIDVSKGTIKITWRRQGKKREELVRLLGAFFDILQSKSTKICYYSPAWNSK